jgi:predicted GIY-YIG superfamily endonuclease
MQVFDRISAPRRRDAWSVYGLISAKDDDGIRYIGVTNNLRARLASHVSTTRRERGHKASWIRSIIDGGGEILIAEIYGGLSQDEALALEVNVIAAYRAAGVRLTNTTDGGEGTRGVSPSAELRAKIGTASASRVRGAETRRRLSETARQLGPQQDNDSGFKGVHYDPQRNQYVARVTLNGKRIRVGRFRSAQDASVARDLAAFNLWGSNCFLNNPDMFK